MMGGALGLAVLASLAAARSGASRFIGSGFMVKSPARPAQGYFNNRLKNQL